MSFSDDLLIFLSGRSGVYKLRRKILHGYPSITKQRTDTKRFAVSDAKVRVTLSRLKQKGFVEGRGSSWRLTQKGFHHLKIILNLTNKKLPRHTTEYVPKSMPKNMVIIFDIPESNRHKRDWLRIELTMLGFVMLQKSVWFGPAPLPQKFVTTLREMGLLLHMKFFEAKEADIV